MPDGPRFLTLSDVAEVLNTSLAQVTALVRRGELAAIKIGGRGQWRVEATELEAFIQRMYVETREFVREHNPDHDTARDTGHDTGYPTDYDTGHGVERAGVTGDDR